ADLDCRKLRERAGGAAGRHRGRRRARTVARTTVGDARGQPPGCRRSQPQPFTVEIAFVEFFHSPRPDGKLAIRHRGMNCLLVYVAFGPSSIPFDSPPERGRTVTFSAPARSEGHCRESRSTDDLAASFLQPDARR